MIKGSKVLWLGKICRINSSQQHTIIFALFGFKYTSVCVLGLDRSLRFISKVRDARSCELSQGNICSLSSSQCFYKLPLWNTISVWKTRGSCRALQTGTVQCWIFNPPFNGHLLQMFNILSYYLDIVYSFVRTAVATFGSLNWSHQGTTFTVFISLSPKFVGWYIFVLQSIVCFLFFNFNGFWQENDVTWLAAKLKFQLTM